jgi:hypothetical protein
MPGNPPGKYAASVTEALVLPGIEQQQPAGVFDHVYVDRPWRQPPP